MSNDTRNSAFLELQQQGLIDANLGTDRAGDNNLQHDPKSDTPWFIKVLFGFSGVFASLLLIGFLSLLLFETKAFDSLPALLVIGLSLSAVGFVLFKSQHTRHNVFMSSLAFAISIAGQSYVAFALLANELPEPLDIWLFLLIQLAMTLIMPNFVYRLLSAVITLSAVVYLLNYYYIAEISLGLLAFIAIVSNLQRYSFAQHIPIKWHAATLKIINAVAYASALMLLAVSVYFIAAEYGNGFIRNDEAFGYNYYLAQTLLTLASLYAAYLILRRYQVKLLSTLGIISIVAILILGTLSIYVSGLLATSLVVIIAMANSQRVLLGVAIIALVSYIFWYYYQLDTTLLTKSISMFVIGIAILLMRGLLIIFYPARSAATANISDINHEERPL
ncbi:DUF4401 domain-containing protein [Psychrobacter sp. M13]|uniref:DUF4401 domain-containing protein n=1 Tax=Psychrobacter sp. M13 TaxID=3067275 RepID=UPI00273BBCF7|nr:DUF4401 domain-containing protein [Psychrobacter sp. M13]WLP94569.1 DUF4401 domain-containing protein [Psychrobacter sp. M13]